MRTGIIVRAAKLPDCVALIEQSSLLPKLFQLGASRTLCTVQDRKAKIRVINPSPRDITIGKGVPVAKSVAADLQNIVPIKETNDEFVNAISDSGINTEKVLQELGIEIESRELSDDQQKSLKRLIAENRDVFATNMSELGKTNIYSHRIDTGSARPQRQHFYRATPEIREAIELMIQEMLENGICEESTSPWAAPVVMIKKKTGDFRMAID